MSFLKLFNTDSFKDVFSEVEQFSSRKLKEYNERLEKTRYQGKNKEIFDAVWGNIEFSAGEVIILDSPLLQRLRNVKQLGLAYFVYCGSDYSRFYHTTGTVFVADRMATSLNKCKIHPMEKQVYFKAVVRLAAIFHDVGHMFLSHVSEHYFAKSPCYPRHEQVNEILDQFKKYASKNVSLHEILSCMIVNTGEVRRLLKCAKTGLEGITFEMDEELDLLIEYISCLIVGVPVDREILPYSSIINGPIDADKCDYLSRDSHVTRVPVAVDISRLTQKLSVVKVEDINKSSLWHRESDTDFPLYELAMEDSAEKALFQLCIARTIMFDSVYYHHKVLTAETELRGLLNSLANLEKPLFSNFDEILEYTDDTFNKYFFEHEKAIRDKEDAMALDKVQKEWIQILNRNMAKRIACIMPEFLEGTQSSKERLFDEVLTTLNSSKEKVMLEEIKSRYENICNLLGKERTHDEECVFVIQSPNRVYGHSKIQVPIHLNNGEKREFKGYELVSSRETSSSSSYFVTNVEHKHLMYLALEKELYCQYRVFLRGESKACGKFEQNEERSNCFKLFEKGFYDDAPDLIPDWLLEQYLSNIKREQIINKFSTYNGPEGYKIGQHEVSAYFKQIISVCHDKSIVQNLVDGIYRMLMASIFLDREFIVRNLSELLKKLEEQELNIIPLGGLKDGGKHIAYYFNDIHIEGKRITTKEKLCEALENQEVLVFFDDGAYSGKQMVSIMQEYMGVPIEQRETTESHVETLPDELQDRLKKKSVVFLYIAFNSERIGEIKEKLSEIGIENVEFIYSEDMSTKFFDRINVFENATQMELVRDFLADVGLRIMKSDKMADGVYKERWSQERVEKSSLGYNDAQQMVFLQTSVPTYTITPFWKGGKTEEFEWKPLFKRTIKEDN